MNNLTVNRKAPIDPQANQLETRISRSHAIALMLASSIAISFSGLIVRSIQDADSWQINFYRALASIAVVIFILALNYRSTVIGRITQIGSPGLVAGGIIAIAGIAFVQALMHTTVANTVFTLCAIPFITTALAYFILREAVSRATLVTMLIAAAGVILMTIQGIVGGTAYGNAMALLAAVCFAGFTIIVRANRQIDMLPTLIVSGTLIAIISYISSGGALDLSMHDLMLCLLWGGVLSGFANWAFIVAARHLLASELTLFMLLEFALGPIWVWILLGEVPPFLALFGGLIVIAAVLLRVLIEAKQGR